jgi:peptidoglycan/xylan/chitin deacetylase (PgdA/CDA1 family)
MLRWIASLLSSSGLLTAALIVRRRLLRRHVVVILSYHHVVADDMPEAERPQDATPATWFRAHLRWLARHFTVISLEEALGLLTGSRLSRDFAVITFDDGYRDSHRTALPILRELGLPATTFLIAGLVGTNRIPWYDAAAMNLTARLRRGPLQVPAASAAAALVEAPGKQRTQAGTVAAVMTMLKSSDEPSRARMLAELRIEGLVAGDRRREAFELLSWNEARELATAGVSFGSHTMSHANLTTMGSREALADLQASKTLIAQGLERPCTSFAFPNGDFDAAAVDAVRRAGYQAACTQRYGTNRPGCDRFTLRRIAAGRTPPCVLALKATGLLAPFYAARDLWRRARARLAPVAWRGRHAREASG